MEFIGLGIGAPGSVTTFILTGLSPTGALSGRGELGWIIEFDWDNDDSFAHDESAYVTALSIERGRKGPFEPFAAGKCTLTLDNNTRRFDPWYTSSAIYPDVQPRRAVKVRCTYSATTYALFLGRIEDIEPTGHIGTRQVVITAYDGLRDLNAVDVQATLQTSIATDTALGLVLDDAGWPAGSRDLDAGNDTLGYWWTDGGELAAKSCNDLASSEYGAFFVSGDGLATFINRQNYATAASAGTLDEDDMADLLLANPWESLYNVVRVRCQPVVEESLATLWQLEDATVAVPPSTSIEIWAEYQDSNARACAATGVIAPVVTTDYTANTTAGGGGTDMTASMTVTANIYSTWAKLTVANTHASTPFYITLLKMRGQALSQVPTTIQRTDTTSQTTYGKRRLDIDLRWQQSVNVATDLANMLKAFYANPSASLTCALDNVFPDLLKYELCDHITVTVGAYSISHVMRLGGLTLNTGQTMQDLKGEFRLEPADQQNYWLLGTAGASELGETTVLGY